MKDKKAFTLVELVISIAISSIVIFWFTKIFMDIQDAINFTQRKAFVFNDIKDFSTKLSYSTNVYNSWLIIKSANKFDTLILTNTGNTNGYIIWVFDCSNLTWVNIKLSSSNIIYNNNCFWYFPLKQSQISSILSNNSIIYSSSFNGGTLYQNLLVRNLSILEFSPNHIFDLTFDFFDNLYLDLMNKNILDINYDKSKLINININL